MDLYTTISKNSATMLQDGSLMRSFISKDGTKIIRQIAQKTGNSAIDVFDKSTNNCIYSYRKTMKSDGQSYITKIFNFLKNKGSALAVQKAQTPDSFMSAKFPLKPTGAFEPRGKFTSYAPGQLKQGDITYFPVGKNSLSTKDPKITLYVAAFNTLFGKVQ